MPDRDDRSDIDRALTPAEPTDAFILALRERLAQEWTQDAPEIVLDAAPRRRPMRATALAAAALVVVAIAAVVVAVRPTQDVGPTGTTPTSPGSSDGPTTSVSTDQPETSLPSATSDTSITPATAVASDGRIVYPFVDPQTCRATGTAVFGVIERPLQLFALSSESPVPIQVVGDPDGGPVAPFAVLLRYFVTDLGIDASHPAAPTMYPDGNGEARWVLPDGSRAYLRSRGLTAEQIRAIVARLVPRDPSAAIPGFDLAPAEDGAPQLLTEQLNTGVTGESHTLTCRAPASDLVYRISALDGDPVYLYGGVIDRPVPLEVGFVGDTLVAIDGERNPAAPTIEDVFGTDDATWGAIGHEIQGMSLHASGCPTISFRGLPSGWGSVLEAAPDAAPGAARLRGPEGSSVTISVPDGNALAGVGAGEVDGYPILASGAQRLILIGRSECPAFELVADGLDDAVVTLLLGSVDLDDRGLNNVHEQVRIDPSSGSVRLFGRGLGERVDADPFVEAVSAAYGAPDADTGWQPMPAELRVSCTDALEYRSVFWADLRVVWERTGDDERLEAWSIGDQAVPLVAPIDDHHPTGSLGITSAEGLAVGADVSMLQQFSIGEENDGRVVIIMAAPVIVSTEGGVITGFGTGRSDCS